MALEVFNHALLDITNYNKTGPLLQAQKQGTMSHLDVLEAEAIHIMREVAAEAENPVMLYSLGKDSSVMLHLAKKAFFPAKPPFPLLHIDTLWKFQAMYDFRDHIAEKSGMELITYTNQEGVANNINPIDHGSSLHTDIMKTAALKQALDKYKFDIAIGGARRDEEKSRAKERIFSFRTNTHQWDPKINDRNFGASSTFIKTRGKVSAHSHCPIGLKWISGCIFTEKRFRSSHFILQQSDQLSNAKIN